MINYFKICVHEDYLKFHLNFKYLLRQRYTTNKTRTRLAVCQH